MNRIEKAGRKAEKAMTAARYDLGENPSVDDLSNYAAHCAYIDAEYQREEKLAYKTLARVLEKARAPAKAARDALLAYKPKMDDMPPDNPAFMKKWIRAQYGKVIQCVSYEEAFAQSA